MVRHEHVQQTTSPGNVVNDIMSDLKMFEGDGSWRIRRALEVATILGHDDLLETISSALLDLRWLIDAVDSGQLGRAEREGQGE